MIGKENKFIIISALLTGISFVFFISTFSNTFSLENELYKFDSLIYTINNNYIENVSVDTSVELFKKYFDVENCYIEVVNDTGVLEEVDLVTNGSRTIVYNTDGVQVATYINIIKGDYNNDGVVDSTDLEGMGQCLVEDCLLTEAYLKGVDIDDDFEFHINDLLLLDQALTNGYTDITLNKTEDTIRLYETDRLVVQLTPNYGLNQNIEWTSDAPNIVTVDELGRITGVSGGVATITAKTKDGTKEAQAKITVDNSIQLEAYSGEAYTNGYDSKVHIDVLNYEGLECSVTNPSAASCSIEGEYLVMKALNSISSTEVTVTGPKYEQAVYKLGTYFISMIVKPKRACNLIGPFSIVGFNHGSLIFESSDPDIVKGGYTKLIGTTNRIFLEYGDKAGRVTVKVKASTGNVYEELIIDRSILRLAERYRFAKVGEEFSIAIDGENLGELSCSLQNTDTEIATCKIEDNQLIVTPVAIGSVDILVNNVFTYEGGWDGNCGSATFTVFVQE